MQLHVKTQGTGNPIILLHGLFGSGDNLGMVARPLSEHFQVISPDLRNHGRSPHSPEMDYPSMAEDVAQLMAHLAIDKCPLLGHSMGGKVAMQLALSQPQRVSRLIVADIAPVAYPPHHADVLEGLKLLDNASFASRSEADRLLAPLVDDVGVRQFLLSNLKRRDDKSFGLRLNLNALISNQERISAALEGEPYNGPTLFLRGATSDYIQPSHQKVIDHLFPNNQLATIENAGHWLHAEQTAAFNQGVLAFLRQ